MTPPWFTRLVVSRGAVPSRAVLAAVAALALLASLPTVGAAFTGTTANPTNSFTAGTVILGSNTPVPAVALLTTSGARPSDPPVVGCIKVTYTGSLPAQVRLFATTGGTGLATYLNLTVERGTIGNATLPDCTGFSPDSATYAAANGVVYSGTLASFATTHGTYAAGLPDPTTASPISWTTGTTATYRFTTTIQNTVAAQGLTATPTLWWEAQNL
jgi:hypothetical protein